MRNHLKFYIDGRWVEPSGSRTFDVINPATEDIAGRISLGEKEDVDRAVIAARKAFETFSQTSREERVALLERIAAGVQRAHQGSGFGDYRRKGRPQLGCRAGAGSPAAGAHRHRDRTAEELPVRRTTASR